MCTKTVIELYKLQVLLATDSMIISKPFSVSHELS